MNEREVEVRDRNDDENPEGNGNGNNWNLWAMGTAAVAAIGGVYWMTRNSQASTVSRTDDPGEGTSQRPIVHEETPEQMGLFTTLINALNTVSVNSNTNDNFSVVSRSEVPLRPVVSNLNTLLADIYVRHIAIKQEDFTLHYRVFTEVFRKLQISMKAVDKYYERYASDVKFAGSHFDRLRINKPDEFDMDIVIALPVNMHKDRYNPVDSDITIEQRYPGFVQLRAGTQYKKILIRDGPDCLINRAAHGWLDERDYILRSKFTDWFKGVVTRGLNLFTKNNGTPVCYVDGVCYTIGSSSSGPAWTLIITANGFRLDVDLVPALKFPEERWLGGKSYREIPAKCRRDYWMVVPKPNKAGNTYHDEQRSWRIALQDQEKQLLKDTNHLRQVIRLVKKVRDVQGMKKIASYYIKTLFFWEIVEKESTDYLFWKKNDVATLFRHMLGKFYAALDSGSIPYFWNRNHNLIENLPPEILYVYKHKLKQLIAALENTSDYKSVAKFLLAPEEYWRYKLLID